MNKSICLFVLVMLFGACKGESVKNTKAESLLTMGQERLLVDEITNLKSVNIKDIFLLLPDDVFPMEEISKENRALLLKHIGEDKAFDISSTPIGVCDVQNGYLNLTGLQYDWEMCYWNLKDGRKLVVVNSGTESGSEIRVFFYQEGKLTDDQNYQLGGNQRFELSDFVEVSQMSPDIRKYAEQQFANGAYHLYYRLPQKGTSISISLDIDDLVDDQENYDVFYEASKDVILKWKNEKWER